MDAPLDNLIRALARLPGLGRRSAERAALALVRRPDDLLAGLRRALDEAAAGVRCCDLCGGFTSAEHNPCRLCTDPRRDDRTICVVEDPGDILSLERAGGFAGRYHALQGKAAAVPGGGPGDVRIQALVRRVAAGGVDEVILAVSTDLDGDATAGLVRELLQPHAVRVTRLAFGLPADSGVGYADPLTLKRALGGRQPA